MNTIVITIIALCAIGIISAIILYFVAQKFKVEEDPRIDIVEGLLPGANCGGCGYPGCRGLAEAAVKADSLDNILCPVGGAESMKKIAAALGREVVEQAPKIAVVKCNGSCENRPRLNRYDGARSCAIEHSLYIGLSRMWRLCSGLPFRCHSYEPSDWIARSLRRKMCSLRCLCQSLPAQYHRTPEQRSERQKGIRILRQ